MKTVIIGAGPAGLTAGYVLAKNKQNVVVLEKQRKVGGLSRTIEHKGFRFDIGPHRFFTKNDEVQNLWDEILGQDFIRLNRLTRIFYDNKYFYYPLKPVNALFGLGFLNCIQILASYMKSHFFPVRPENNFEAWVSNRFGRRLYSIFFKSYTEKVWGMPCHLIDDKWASQRVQGLSLFAAVLNAFGLDKKTADGTLLNQFYYPKYGAGQMYETMQAAIEGFGQNVLLDEPAVEIGHSGNKIVFVQTEKGNTIQAQNLISSMPVDMLINCFNPSPPREIIKSAEQLNYRSHITVNLLCKGASPFKDNWLYIHDSNISAGRIVNFNNWGGYMTPDTKHVGITIEYFCRKNDELWNMTDEQLLEKGKAELNTLGLANGLEIYDGFIVRSATAYPVYDQAYQNHLTAVKDYLDTFENLQLIGRAGMFKYNNMDHSILTGLYAAKNILGQGDYNIWYVNVDKDYYESKSD